MRCRGIVFPALALACLMFAQVVQALTMEPPLPGNCAMAEKVEDPAIKVSLYTRCLEGNNKQGGSLEDYQRYIMHFHRANALFELRRYPEALADYDLFIAKSNGHVWALHQRGLTLREMGQRQLALLDFNKALEINSNAIPVRFDRGQLFAEMGLYSAAAKDLRMAAISLPDTALYINAFAWLLATCPDPKIQDGNEAVRFASKAVSIERDAQYLDTLAAALARQGNFRQAVETQQMALDLLRKDMAGQETIMKFAARLNLYTLDKPYTQDSPE